MNDTSKSIFTSVTFWGLLLGLLGPLSTRFGYTMPSDTTGLANEIVGIVGALVALYGRFTATNQVHIVPPSDPTTKQGGFANMRMITAIALTSLAVACAVQPQTPAQGVYAVQGAYASALTIAVAYKQLPPCGLPTSPKLCSNASVVTKLQAADNAAYAALSAAQVTVATPGAGLNAQTAIVAAEQAVQALTAITNQLQVK